MQRPVIVSLDGTEKDARAVAVAKAIANLADADLRVVRVIEVPSNRLLALAGGIGVDPAAVTGLRDAEIQLADIVAGARERTGRRVTSDVLEANDVGGSIIEYITQHDAQILVMATRAPGALGRAVGGSVADQVVRESPRPVMVVPPGAAFLAGKTVQFARVLVPQDGSTIAFRCLEFLIELPKARELEYFLLEVVPSGDSRAAAEARLETTALWLRSRGARSVEFFVAEANDAAAAIIESVREVLPDIIAMSTRGSGGLGRLVLGSVAEGVVRNSELPVLLLTPKMLAT
jgi:nucleotide-binding universal stress UspA family protein